MARPGSRRRGATPREARDSALRRRLLSAGAVVAAASSLSRLGVEANRFTPSALEAFRSGLGHAGAGASVAWPEAGRGPLDASVALEAVADPFDVRETLVDNWGWLEPGEVRLRESTAPVSKKSSRGPPKGGVTPVTYYEVDTKDGARLVKHYKITTALEAEAAKQEVRTWVDSKDKNMFLNLYGWTLAPAYFSEGKDVLVMSEHSPGTLRDFLKRNQGKLNASTVVDMFLKIMGNVRTLRRLRIPHNAPSVDEVVMVGSMDNPSEISVALCSSLANTPLQVCSAPREVWQRLRGHLEPVGEYAGDIREMEFRDVVKLGDLFLRMHGSIHWEDRQKHDEVLYELRALARKMDTDDGSMTLKAALRQGKRLRKALPAAKSGKRRLKMKKTRSMLKALLEYPRMRLFKREQPDASLVSEPNIDESFLSLPGEQLFPVDRASSSSASSAASSSVPVRNPGEAFDGAPPPLPVVEPTAASEAEKSSEAAEELVKAVSSGFDLDKLVGSAAPSPPPPKTDEPGRSGSRPGLGMDLLDPVLGVYFPNTNINA